MIKLILGAAGNIACYGPVLTERASVVIELFVIYKVDYSSYNDCFWCSAKIHNIFFLHNYVLHTPVILLTIITIVSGDMINYIMHKSFKLYVNSVINNDFF